MKIFFFILILLVSTVLFANETVYYEFSYPKLSHEDKYTIIEIDGCIISGEEGTPALPMKACNVLLGSGEAAIRLKINKINYYKDEHNFRVKPCGRPVQLSMMERVSSEVIEGSVYSEDSIYPAENHTQISTGFLRGHSIAYFSLCPVEYNPVTGQVRFVKNIELELITIADVKARESAQYYRHDRSTKERLEKLVDNPEVVDNYHNSQVNRIQEYDILLISSEELAETYAEYLNYKESCGYYTLLITVEDIESSYTGIDRQSKIRNAIIDIYQDCGISYVILAGDSNPENPVLDVIPHRGFFGEAGNSIDNDIAADMYYGCLDGSWNNNNNSIWGELSECDPFAEVNVGRLSSEYPVEALEHLEKLQMYQEEPVEESLENYLMVGEHLFFEYVYGGMYLWEIWHGGMWNSYYTEGFSDNINVIELYEMNEEWTSEDLFSHLNSGVNMVHHIGHGNTAWGLGVSINEIDPNNLTNDGIDSGFYNIYSQACYSGAFDNRLTQPESYYWGDSFAEAITECANGAVSFIGNSRYGWGDNNGTNGVSQAFHRYFSDAMFGEGIFNIGDALTYSKEVLAGSIASNSTYCWVYYDLNLLGDPTMDIYTAQPDSIIIEYPQIVELGITELSISSYTGNYRAGLMQGSTLLARGIADEAGNLTLELDSPLLDSAPLTLSAIAHNHYRRQVSIEVDTEVPCLQFDGCQFNEVSGNGNGQAEYTETISFDLELSNIGEVSATDVELHASSENEYITFTDSMESVIEIIAESSIILENAITCVIADNIPDREQICITLDVSESSGTEWSYDFFITAYAPELCYMRSIIDDSQGNANGVMDPGETSVFEIDVINSGHSISPELEISLTSADPEISITDIDVTFGEIMPAQTVTGTFSVLTGENATPGEPIEFLLQQDYGAYCTIDTLLKYPGIYIEDFESHDYSTFDWEFTGNKNWKFDYDAYEGRYAACSGNCEFQENSGILLEFDTMYDDSLSFYVKTLSHICDNLEFYIDGLLIEEWSGENDWARKSYYLHYGHHVVEWMFHKNHYISNGSDCVLVDNIIFPEFGIAEEPVLYVDTQLLEFECCQGEILESIIQIENRGGGTLSYELSIDETSNRDLSSCYLEINTTDFEPGLSAGWCFTAHNQGTDNESIYRIEIQMPEGVTLHYAECFHVAYNRDMYWDEVTGDGVVAVWENMFPDSSGVIHNDETASANVQVSVIDNFTGMLELPYTLYGNGSAPQTVSDTLYLTSEYSWIDIDPLNGALNGGSAKSHNIMIDTNLLTEGVHHCDIVISSAEIAEDFHIPVSLNVHSNETQNNTIPLTTDIISCYPNPFNPTSTLDYQIDSSCLVTISIYNLKGQHVRTLVSKIHDIGKYNITWNGCDDTGKGVSSGIYFYRLTTSEHTRYKRVMLLK